MNIPLHHHCSLCEHQQVNLKEGSVCGLTDRKPHFHRTCSKIVLADKFEAKLKQVNIEYEYKERQKWWVIAYVFTFTLISLFCYYLLLLFDQRFAEVLANSNSSRGQGMLVLVYILLAAAGAMFVIMGVRALNTHLGDKKALLHRKQKVDAVLELYNIPYTIAIDFGKKYHGTQEVEVDLKLKGN